MRPDLLKISLLTGCLCVGKFAANVAWLVHLDCDALRPTTVGQYILAEMDKPEARAKLAPVSILVHF